MKKTEGGGDAFEKTREYLGRLLAYLESLHASLDWESESANSSTAADGSGAPSGGTSELPAHLTRILADNGYLEGLSLKARGSLSSDLVEFIRDVGFAFEVEVAPRSVFKLPFVDNELAVQRKTLNVFMEKAWRVYHAALLSAYALRPLRIERVEGGEGEMEEIVRVVAAQPAEREDGGGPGPEALHAANNALAGITSYVSLVLAERKTDADLQQKLGLILEAAHKAGEAIKRK